MSFRGMNPLRVFEIPSDSNPTRSYMVTQWDSEDIVTCTCPAFLYGRQQRGLDVLDRNCKHTERTRNELREDNTEFLRHLTPISRAISPDDLHKPMSVETTPLTAKDKFAQALQKKKDVQLKELDALDPRVRALIFQMAGRVK